MRLFPTYCRVPPDAGQVTPYKAGGGAKWGLAQTFPRPVQDNKSQFSVRS